MNPLSFIHEIAQAIGRGKSELAETLLNLQDEEIHGEENAQQARQFMDEVYAHTSVQLTVSNDDGWEKDVLLNSQNPRATVGDILPGVYSIELSTGRQLWKRRLREDSVLWDRAFPLENLPMAADTGELPIRFSREEILVPEELILRVYPGVHSGTLEIHLLSSL